MDFPIRINTYIARKGYASRRRADELIEKGEVMINGAPAELGQKVHEGDVVEVSEKVEKMPRQYHYIAVNKPRGIVSHNPQRGERGIKDIATLPERVTVLGRLDKNSRGLLVFSSDGRIVDPMLNPDRGHEKEYVVKVNKPLTESFLRKMEKGVYIEGYTTRPARTKRAGEKTFRLILTEGKKHQIRRMVTALGYEVVDLKRIRIINIKLGNLSEGEKREISGKELEVLLETLGVPRDPTNQ